jgi:lipopolysaccharide export LptBFGC system permease protein LptF
VLIVASVLSVAAFVNVAWVVPASNQAYRVSVGGPLVAKGANELTLRELRPLTRPGAAIPAVILMPQGPRWLASLYYARWALAFAPLALSLFALSLGRQRHTWASIAMTTMCIAYAGYYLVDPAFSAYLSPIAFGWTPNLVAVVAAIALQALPNQSALSPEP